MSLSAKANTPSSPQSCPSSIKAGCNLHRTWRGGAACLLPPLVLFHFHGSDTFSPVPVSADESSYDLLQQLASVLHWLSSLPGTHWDHLRHPFQPTLWNGNRAESDGQVQGQLLWTHTPAEMLVPPVCKCENVTGRFWACSSWKLKMLWVNIWNARAEALKIRHESRMCKITTEIPALIIVNSSGVQGSLSKLQSPFPQTLSLPWSTLERSEGSECS